MATRSWLPLSQGIRKPEIEEGGDVKMNPDVLLNI
jgi:hypothetical protein